MFLSYWDNYDSTRPQRSYVCYGSLFITQKLVVILREKEKNKRKANEVLYTSISFYHKNNKKSIIFFNKIIINKVFIH